jgi:folate-dependent tRNA-U54 methylase TrmFO/GidA
VKYLDCSELPELDKDWLPAPAVTIFVNRKEMIQKIYERIENDSLIAVNDEEIQNAIHEAVLIMWRHGIKQYVSSMMVPIIKNDNTDLL